MSLAKAQQPTYQDDNLSPESFSILLKDEWVYLRDAIDQLNKETEKRGEFETTPEFQARAARAKQLFLDKLNGRIKETKLDRRLFGVWFKATLVSYDADAGVYSVSCATTVEAPYDIPTVECFIPDNPYVEKADSIRGGYRTSSLRLKFNPDFKWTVARNDAMTAKSNEPNIYFKVHFEVNVKQEDFSTQALLKIIPKDITLINQVNKFMYWKEEIK
jgi:hypothetical protein